MKSAIFQLSDFQHGQSDSGPTWREFLSVDSLSMGVYQVPVGPGDRATHPQHDRDEVYVVTSGAGKVTVNGEAFEIEEQQVIFVQAGVSHFFHDVTATLVLLVFFAGPQPNPA